MKKLIAVSALFLAVLFLTSCLRDASPSYPAEDVTVLVTPHVTEMTTAAQTEPVLDAPPVKPHAEVMKWSSSHPSPDAVIMSLDEIKAENDRIADASEAIVDIFAFGDTVTAERLSELIMRHSVPSETRYDSDGAVISEEHKANMRERMKLDDTLHYDVRRAVVTSRGDLRAIPDSKPYRKAPDNPYDSIQHTELTVGTPVLVLYTTADAEYYFVVSHFYFGWISCSDIALSRDDDLFMSFAAPESFVCITDPLYRDGDAVLDMGCVLPMISEEKNAYRVLLPVRDAEGYLTSRETVISVSSAVEGYLPYTYENYLTQAFKYEGTEYGWGGLNDGVDCSGFVLNVFRTFGFSFPRDTKDQDKVVGGALSVKGKSHEEIASELDGTVPTAVYYPGHTLLYLGHDSSDGKHYFIHAPQIGEKVSVTSKTDLSGMTYIGRIGKDPIT